MFAALDRERERRSCLSQSRDAVSKLALCSPLNPIAIPCGSLNNGTTETITIWYVLVDDAYQRLIAKCSRPLRTRGPEPQFSDSKVITVLLIIETFFRGREDRFYSFLQDGTPGSSA